MTVSSAADAGRKAAQHGKQVERSRWFQLLVTVGLISYGVVHLLIAWIALQIAFTGGGGEASDQGAFSKLASNPVGDVLLWVVALGLFTMAIWQLFLVIWGFRELRDQAKRTRKRLASGAKVVLYAVLAVSAASTAAEGAKSGNAQPKALTAQLMSVAFGRILVVAIGLVVLGVGGYLIYEGIAKKFTEDLEGGRSEATIRLGQVGFVAKGVALGVVGILFVLASIRFDPNRAGGLDTALRTLRQQPFGVVLLTAVALGIACFGLYCFAWSRHVKRS